MNNYSFRRRKRSANSFDPNHTQIEDAVANYLNAGGKILRIDATDLKRPATGENKVGVRSVDDYSKGS